MTCIKLDQSLLSWHEYYVSDVKSAGYNKNEECINIHIVIYEERRRKDSEQQDHEVLKPKPNHRNPIFRIISGNCKITPRINDRGNSTDQSCNICQQRGYNTNGKYTDKQALNFRHKNSVLCWLNRGRAECAAGMAVPVAHLIFQNSIITILTCGLFVPCKEMHVWGTHK